jgi:hypothetical protein
VCVLVEGIIGRGGVVLGDESVLLMNAAANISKACTSNAEVNW